jgi:hypothetical protein
MNLSAIASRSEAWPLKECKFCSKSPSSGDCERAAERVFSQQEGLQFGSEMAAPDLKIENTNWHRSWKLHQECEWKQGESAVWKTKSGKAGCSASRWSAISIRGDATKTHSYKGGV